MEAGTNRTMNIAGAHVDASGYLERRDMSREGIGDASLCFFCRYISFLFSAAGEILNFSLLTSFTSPSMHDPVGCMYFVHKGL